MQVFIIDNVNYTSVVLNYYNLDSKSMKYVANITVNMSDAFGLDKGDVKRFQNMALLNFATGNASKDGFQAWWLFPAIRSVPTKRWSK